MLFTQQLGRYHLLDRIAMGGMAEIYRAKTFDAQGNEHFVAIKRVISYLADDDDFLQMLVDEAKITSVLQHENIAKVYEFARVGDEYFIVMEYIKGKDIRSILDRCRAKGTSLTIVDCAYVIMRILEGLHSAHEKCDGTGRSLHIVHRDVSPSNIMISYQGHIKLCDFGIAKARLSRIQTQAGVIKGKLKYMSPEQAMGHPIDRRSDVFSAGSVLYEMLTLQCPFQADDDVKLILNVRNAKYPLPSTYNPHIPSALERIINRALQRSPQARYQTTLEFANDLKKFIHQTAPSYIPGTLGRFLQILFAEEIQQCANLAQEYMVGDADPTAIGENLLAEVLGEGAPYTQFTPVNPSQHSETTIKTRILPRIPPPEYRLPEEADLHSMPTTVFDPEEHGQHVRKRKFRPRPSAQVVDEEKEPTQCATVYLSTEEESDSQENLQQKGEFFSSPTQIIR